MTIDSSQFPDPQSVLLPSKAYLKSFSAQNLPARRAAFEDALAHFSEAAANDDEGWRDMALLGVVGEAMQQLEDLAYIGTAYAEPLRGIAHYVTATVFNARTPNNFYSSIRYWDDARLKLLLGLYGHDPETHEPMALHSAPEFADRLDPADIEAIEEAASATVAHVRPHLLVLSEDWERFRRYHHAFKHGGLVMNRDDVELVDQDDVPLPTSIGVWLRRHGGGHGDTTRQPDEIAKQVAHSARWALRISEFIVDARLQLFSALTFGNDGTIQGLADRWFPHLFWFAPQQVSEPTKQRLKERFGVVGDAPS